MVWFASQDSAGAVYLLYGKQTHKFVRKCHGRERNHGIGTVVDFLAEAIGPSDGEDERPRQLHTLFLQKIGPLARSVLLSALVE